MSHEFKARQRVKTFDGAVWYLVEPEAEAPGFWRLAGFQGGEATHTIFHRNLTPFPEEPEPKPRFAKGQRVRVVGKYFRGREGVLERTIFAEPEKWVVVQDDGASLMGLSESDLEPIATEPLRDGQANTSGLKADSSIDGWQSAMTRAFNPPPSLATVLEGVARWQQSDPGRRRVRVECQGHTALVHITLLGPPLRMTSADFSTPESAEATHDILDRAAVIAETHPNIGVTNARNPRYRFREDSGEIEL